MKVWLMHSPEVRAMNLSIANLIMHNSQLPHSWLLVPISPVLKPGNDKTGQSFTAFKDISSPA